MSGSKQPLTWPIKIPQRTEVTFPWMLYRNRKVSTITAIKRENCINDGQERGYNCILQAKVYDIWGESKKSTQRAIEVLTNR